MLRVKNILSKIFLVIIGLLVGIVISEIIADRYIKETKLDKKLKYIMDKSHSRQPDIGCGDEDLGWSCKPYAKDRLITSEFDIIYSINSKGLRDKEISFEKTKQEFRIVALGESNVFGEGINYGKRFTEIIEEVLDNVEVINMGIWGFGMDQSFLQLKRDGFKFQPDLIVLFVIEDFLQRCKDFIRIGAFKPRFILGVKKNELILQDLNYVKNMFTNETISKVNNFSKRIEETNKRNNFLKKSKLLALINYYKERNMIDEKFIEQDRVYWKNIFKMLDTIDTMRRDYNPEDFKKLIFLLLKKYKELCDEHKADFLVITIVPDKIDYIDGFCYDLGISYLDLFGVLNRASRVKSLSFKIDPHYNEFTHKIIGEYVASYIKNKYKIERNKEYAYQFLDKF